VKIYDVYIRSLLNNQIVTWDRKNSQIKIRNNTGLKEENWNIVILEDNKVSINSSIRFNKKMIGVWDIYIQSQNEEFVDDIFSYKSIDE
jgi:UDP-3-O-acyl-N-acetylglucosamine deacetylase